VRPVQQQIFPRASVESATTGVSFTMFTTGGTLTDNLATLPRATGDIHDHGAAGSAPALVAADTVGPLYDINPSVFGQSDLLIESTDKVGDDTRVFNGVGRHVQRPQRQGRHVPGRHQHGQGDQ
jgi:hypothetical protein